MANQTQKLLYGPAYLAGTAAANTALVYQGGTAGGGVSASTGVKDIIQQLTLCNDDTSARVFTLYIDSTSTGHTAGKEIFSAYSLAASTSQTFNVMIPLLSTQYLTGWADASSMVTITVLGSSVIL
jgi:hypothetical protein